MTTLTSCHIQHLKWVLRCQYKVLLCFSSKFSGDLKPYIYSFSCYGYLWHGSWLDTTINSALSSLWHICLQTDDLRDSLVPTRPWTHIHVDKLGLTQGHTHTMLHWPQDDGAIQISVMSLNAIQSHCHQVSSICPFPWNRWNVWNQFCIHLSNRQPQQTDSRGDPKCSCLVHRGVQLWLCQHNVLNYRLTASNGKPLSNLPFVLRGAVRCFGTSSRYI